MSAPTEACPGCGRANVNWRVTCLYCGVRMPNPAAPPPPKAVPDNLDALVREAMRGGSLDKVRRALEESKGGESPVVPAAPPRGAPAPQPASPAAPPPSSAAAPGPAPTPPGSPPGAPVPAPEVSIPPAPGRGELLRGLEAAAAQVLAAGEQPDRLGPALDALEGWVRRLRADLAAPPPPRPVVLPPIRHPFALVVDGIGDPELGVALAPLLEVDPATARAIAAVRHVHVALRGADRAGLDRRAAAVCTHGRVRASVVARAALLEIPAARCVLARDREVGWRVLDQPLWEEGVDPSQRPPGEPLAAEEVRLVVPGEVEVKLAKGSTESSRWLRQGWSADPAAAEQRIAVLDLHTPSHILRITPGTTRFDGFPTHDPSSPTRSFKHLLDGLEAWFPGARVEARRVCAATNASGDARYTSGWPAWEEHTRIARVHVLGGGDREG